MPARHYLNESGGWQSWLLTTDHKRIGLLYLFSITVMFFLGGFFALLIRLELLTPAGDLMTSDVYNRVFTMHGVIMVFFFLIPSIPATLGNFLLPLMLGAKDLAFPAHQPPQLVPLHHRRACSGWPRSSAAASTRAGRSTRRTARWPRTRAC